MTFKKKLLGTMVSMAVTAGMTTTVTAQQIPAQDLTKFSVSGNQANVKKGSGVYIIQMKQAPGITYAEEIGELIPNKQHVASRGNQYASDTKQIRNYTSKLKRNQRAAAAAVGNVKIIHNYVHSFNGFSAKLTPAQAKALRANPEVASVWEDQMVKVDTANTPEFLGLTGAGGQHTLGIKGEDVIVGILDTGITPENPSFADDGSYSDPADIGWQGACDTGEEAQAGTFACNNKLIGARFFPETFQSVYDIQTELGEFMSPRDADGHGSHTASTAAGNEGVSAVMNGTEIGVMSGIAPRARVAMYKVCWNSDYVNPQGGDEAGCFYGDSMAAIEQAIVDGVDVLNYSIGGSLTDLTVPSTAAMLRAAQAGVFVSVSAGNSGPAASTTGTPAPWVTTVGASTYDGTTVVNGLEVTQFDETSTVAFTEGSITKPLSETGPVTGSLVVAEPLLACFDGAASTPLDNAADISGNIALIQRGSCAFSQKVSRALDSGATAVVVYDNGGGVTVMGGDFVGGIPGGMVTEAVGSMLNSSAVEGGNVTVTMSAGTYVEQEETGNIMADFSSRGPNASTLDVIKPDITAPGVRILAATSDTPMFGEQGKQVAYLSGTSMSSPHIAGMAALLIDQHPDWTPAQVKSALMTTAYQDVTKEDGSTPADPFDFGAGHAAPVSAMEPGLTFDASFFDYMGFMCGLDEESFVISESGYDCATYEANYFPTDPSQLNYPSIAIGELSGAETIYRYVSDVTGADSTYTISIEGLDSLDVSVQGYNSDLTPVQGGVVEVAANGTSAFALTVAKTEETVLDEWIFGAVVLEGDNGKVVRSPVAIMPAADENISAPESVSVGLNSRGRGFFSVGMNYTGRASIDYASLVAPEVVTSTVEQDPDSSFAFNEDGLSTTLFHIPEGTTMARFSLRDELVEQSGTDLDLYVYRCEGWLCSEVGVSAFGGSDEDVVLMNPEPAANVGVGDVYIVWVHGWDLNGATETDFQMPVWVAGGKDSSSRFSMSSRAVDGRLNDVRIITRGLASGVPYMGTVTFFDGDGQEQGTTIVEAVKQ
ncbi:S8 family serine peptidase [Alteromonas sp. 1_MG-2023]|uniref:S8 family serine peptidase n=1 Tax=Alteromonas sp. 1_MG-2023 TaxID=3062669 RepID=UPI0026E3A030|nr:S8 family serine peptidase [Alteromonas sp. 1_MG-2023]MDO6475998.1 S8 family serine peptidase [Alteromonas sp. 1_MG-2023]